MTTKNRLPKTAKPFMAWLNTLPAGRKMCPVSPQTCPLAQFMKSRLPEGTRVGVGAFDYRVGPYTEDTVYHKQPDWAQHVFSVASDHASWSDGRMAASITAGRLRKALRETR